MPAPPSPRTPASAEPGDAPTADVPTPHAPTPHTPTPHAPTPRVLTARALLLGERIDIAGLERQGVIATQPLALRIEDGLLVVFRYGVVVSIGLDLLTEDRVLRDITPRVREPLAEREEEEVEIAAASARQADEGVGPDGTVRLADLAPERLLVVADALAKSTVLAGYERQMAEVFDTLEPWAQDLARGRRPAGRGRMTRLIGQALLVQHRLAERVAVREKPEILWDRPELERLYARLEAEYELIDRSDALQRKLDLIGETVTVMTDLIDTQRSLRLEFAVVALIVAEIIVGLAQLLRG